MAKVSYANLKLKVDQHTETFDFGGQSIEVKQYLPIEDKYDLIMIALQKAEEDGVYNPVKVQLYFELYTVYMYSNISFTDKQKENETKLYDTLASNASNCPTGHMLSSQISCVNHLFPLMKVDESASLLLILNAVQDRYRLTRILPNPLDKFCAGNICFEFIWKNRTLLGESREIRGAKCTSIDAVVYAETEELGVLNTTSPLETVKTVPLSFTELLATNSASYLPTLSITSKNASDILADILPYNVLHFELLELE